MHRQTWILVFATIFVSSFLFAQNDTQEIEDIDIYQYAGQLMPTNLLTTTDVTFNDVPIELALNTMQDEHGIELSYNNSKIPHGKRINLHMENVFVLEALLGILHNTGMTLQVTKGGNLALIEGDVPSIGKRKVVSGKIIGLVKDKTTGEPLPGANAFLQGTSMGAASALDGKYSITNIPPGNYTLVVKYIGYKDIEIVTSVPANGSVTVNAELEFAALQADQEVVITAQAEGQMKAINQQLSARSIVSVVSADRIQEIPDANAAESVGRLPGVSIKRSSGEGDEIVIRGLQPKLNLVTVNGIRMPSTNEENTAVGLAGISQYMLDGIEVRKSLTAQDDADVVGGIVDLKLATAEDGFHINTIADGMYNGLTNQFNSYRATVQASNRFFSNLFGVIAQVNMEKADRTRERYSASYNRDTRQSVNEGVFLTGGNYQLHEIVRDRFSANLLLDYRLRRGKIQVSSIFNSFDEDQWRRDYSFSVSAYNNATKDHTSKIVNKTTWVNGFTLETLLFKNVSFDFSASMTQGIRKEPENNNMIFKYDASGPALFDPKFVESTFGKTGYDAISYFLDDITDYQLYGVTQQQIKFKENESTVQSNFKIPIRLGRKLSGFVQFGGKARFKDRNYDYETDGSGSFIGGSDEYITGILQQNPDLDWPFAWYDRPQGDPIPAYPVFGNWSQNILKDRVLLDGFAKRSLVDQITRRLAGSNWLDLALESINCADLYHDYSGDEKLYAGYFMTEFNVGRMLTLNAGVRYENEETNYKGYGVIDIASQSDIVDTLDTSRRINDFWLPSLNMKLNYMKGADIRFAYSHSLARPDYYAFLPHYYANLRWTLSQTAGNSDLKPSMSRNYDLTFSFYNNAIGLFTLGGFYKQIDDYYYARNFAVIDVATDNLVHGYENLEVPKGEYINVWYNSPKPAFIKGLEFDWQTNFWYLPKPLNGLVLNVNYTLINSKASYYVADVEKEYYGSKPWEFTEVLVDSFQTRRMIDQPNNTFNLSLGYDYKGFSMRIAYYYQGNTLAAKGTYTEDDYFSHDYQRWDFSMTQSLPVKGLSIQLLLNNITSEPDRQYCWTTNFTTSEEYYGRTGSIGLKYIF